MTHLRILTTTVSWGSCLVGTLVLILGSAPSLSASSAQVKTADLVQSAMQATQQGQWAEAVKLYQQAIEQEPNNAGLYNNLGVVLRRQGDLKGAIVAYRKTVELDANLNAVYVNLAIAYLSDQQWDQALETLAQAQARTPLDRSLLLYQGLAYEKLQQWQAAARAYESYTLSQPNALGYYRLAVAYWQSGEGSQAAEAFRRAARLDPSVGLYSSEAGRALAKLGVSGEAAAFLERLPQDWPDPTDFMVLARLAYQLDRSDVANAAIQRAMQLSQPQSGASPDTPLQVNQIPANLLNDAGVLSADQQDLVTATRYLQAAAANADRQGEAGSAAAIAYSNLADVYLAQNQLDLALAAGQESLQRHPELPQAHNTLATVLIRLNRTAEAIERLQQATQLDPDYWQAYRNLAIAYALAGQQDQASQAMLVAIDKAPTLQIVQTLNEELIKLQQVAVPTASPTGSE